MVRAWTPVVWTVKCNACHAVCSTLSDGDPANGPAVPNGRCRMHGGMSTGPRTPQGLERSRKANWKHGWYSAERFQTAERQQRPSDCCAGSWQGLRRAEG